jgi:hypothetical protein
MSNRPPWCGLKQFAAVGRPRNIYIVYTFWTTYKRYTRRAIIVITITFMIVVVVIASSLLYRSICILNTHDMIVGQRAGPIVGSGLREDLCIRIYNVHIIRERYFILSYLYDGRRDSDLFSYTDNHWRIIYYYVRAGGTRFKRTKTI